MDAAWALFDEANQRQQAERFGDGESPDSTTEVVAIDSLIVSCQQMCEQAIGADQNNVSALILLGKVLVEQRGHLANGYAMLSRAALQLPSNAQFCFEQSRCLLFLCCPGEAWETTNAFIRGQLLNDDRSWRTSYSVYDLGLIILAILAGYLSNPYDPFLLRLLQFFRALPQTTQTMIRKDLPVMYNFAATVAALPPLPLKFARMKKQSTEDNVVYVLGDSHILPLAWHLILDPRDQNKFTELRPLLAIGLKAWNFTSNQVSREASILASNVAELPTEPATYCICIAGEIDCRILGGGGIPGTVRRGKYSSIADAVHNTVAVYVKGLEELSLSGARVIFVHPVRPASHNAGPEQRDIIVCFNHHLAQALAEQRSNHQTTADLRWLDFYERLCGNDGFVLPEFENPNDQTHLSPAYIPLLQDALVSCCQKQK